MANHPHSNNLVLLLKAPKADEQTDMYGQVLEAAGFQAYSVPALSFTFVNLGKLCDALLSDIKYSCLVLTSPRSIEAIQCCFTSKVGDWKYVVCPVWSKKPTFVVGNATSAAACRLGLSPQGADAGNASNLAPIVVSELKGMADTERSVLMPCGQLALETLPKALRDDGISVECLTVYETVADPSFADNVKDFIETRGRPMYIVFFSPSIVRFSRSLLDSFGLLCDSVQLIAIGPSTETEMRSAFGRVDGVASKPTAQHVADLLKQLHRHTLLPTTSTNWSNDSF